MMTKILYDFLYTYTTRPKTVNVTRHKGFKYFKRVLPSGPKSTKRSKDGKLFKSSESRAEDEFQTSSDGLSRVIQFISCLECGEGRLQ